MPVEMPLMGLPFSSMSVVAPTSNWSFCEQSQLLSFFTLLCDHGNCLMHLVSIPAVLKFPHHFCSNILSWSVPELVTATTVVSLSQIHNWEQACWWSWEFLISASGEVKGAKHGTQWWLFCHHPGLQKCSLSNHCPAPIQGVAALVNY